MYKTTESLCCIPKTNLISNIISQLYFNNRKKKTGLANIFYIPIVPLLFLCRIYHFSNYTNKFMLLGYLTSHHTLHKARDWAYFINLFPAFAGSSIKLYRRKERKKPLLETSGPYSSLINQDN